MAAPATGLSSQGTPDSSAHGSGNTIVVSAGVHTPAPQASEAGDDLAMDTRATSSRSRAPSDGNDTGNIVQKSRRGEKSSSPRGSADENKSADQQLDEELRKGQKKTEAHMAEAAEQYDEYKALRSEYDTLEARVRDLESDKAGSLQRILTNCGASSPYATLIFLRPMNSFRHLTTSSVLRSTVGYAILMPV